MKRFANCEPTSVATILYISKIPELNFIYIYYYFNRNKEPIIKHILAHFLEIIGFTLYTLQIWYDKTIFVLLTVTSCRAMIVVHKEVSITGREISCRISGWDPLGCRVPQPRIIILLQLLKARSF